jgi:hypothetical protein
LRQGFPESSRFWRQEHNAREQISFRDESVAV